jgi:hypothetical protein
MSCCNSICINLYANQSFGPPAITDCFKKEPSQRFVVKQPAEVRLKTSNGIHNNGSAPELICNTDRRPPGASGTMLY